MDIQTAPSSRSHRLPPKVQQPLWSPEVTLTYLSTCLDSQPVSLPTLTAPYLEPDLSIILFYL